VQRVRESAAQTVCRNNLKQIALAVRQYEVANKTLPPAGIGYGWCEVIVNIQETQGFVPVDYLPDPHIVNQNGLSLLLPYLGQESLDAQLDRSKAFSLAASPYDSGTWPTTPSMLSPNGMNPVQNGSSFTAADLDLVNNTNLALMGTQLAIFRCPSDPGDPVIPADGASFSPLTAPYTPKYGPGGNFNGAKTNYDFVTFAVGDDECNAWRGVAPGASGGKYMFAQNSFCPILRVTDGMSNTFMLAETLFTTAGAQCPAWGYRSLYMRGIDPFGGINTNPDGALPFGTVGTPDSAGSVHPGGCFFAMGDGSVRWVSQSTGLDVLLAMSTMNGGEVADSD
jgi:hypothetical protein